MDTSLALTQRLSEQIDQLLERLAAEQADNARLNAQLQALSTQHAALTERIDLARQRLDAVLQSLPPTEHNEQEPQE